MLAVVAALVGAQAPRAQLQGAVRRQEGAPRHVDIAEGPAEPATAVSGATRVNTIPSAPFATASACSRDHRGQYTIRTLPVHLKE